MGQDQGRGCTSSASGGNEETKTTLDSRGSGQYRSGFEEASRSGEESRDIGNGEEDGSRPEEECSKEDGGKGSTGEGGEDYPGCGNTNGSSWRVADCDVGQPVR
jgi:hypothetical protein